MERHMLKKGELTNLREKKFLKDREGPLKNDFSALN